MIAWYKFHNFPAVPPLVDNSLLSTLDLTGPLAVRSIERHNIAQPIQDWLSDHGMRCLRGLVFYRSGPNTPSVHRDMRQINGVANPAYAAINFQIAGLGRMDFYHMPDDNKTVYDTNARTAYQAWPDDSTLRLADQVLFDDQPILVRVDVPHRIESLAESRTSVSIRFTTKPKRYLDSWQEAVDGLASSLISRTT